jgi:hypothetical protein
MPVVATTVRPAARVDPVEVFKARCEARALLVYACELDPHDAVDVLQDAAMANGLVDTIGQDAVQQMIAAAFVVIRRLDQCP